MNVMSISQVGGHGVGDLLQALVFSERLYVVVRPFVCRLSVTFVHPTKAIEIFGNVFKPFGTFDIY